MARQNGYNVDKIKFNELYPQLKSGSKNTRQVAEELNCNVRQVQNMIKNRDVSIGLRTTEEDINYKTLQQQSLRTAKELQNLQALVRKIL